MSNLNEISALYAASQTALLLYNKISNSFKLQLKQETLNNASFYSQNLPFQQTISPNNAPGFRPKEWDNPDLVYARTSVNGYFFDAVIKADHTTTVKKTQHPVQDRGSISDHAYKMPDRLVLEIGMSDAMDSFIPGQFETSFSKSISAYAILKDLQKNFVLLDITTRLQNYSNMLIESIHVSDDFKTRDSLRATITFEELFVQEVNQVTVSARKQVTSKPVATSKNPIPANTTVLRTLEDTLSGDK